MTYRAEGLATLVIALGGYFVFAMFRLSFGVVLAEITPLLEISKVEGGLLVSSNMAVMAVTAFFSGRLTDRLGFRAINSTGLLIFSAGMLLASQAKNFLAIAATVALSGFGAGMMVPSLYVGIGRYSSSSRASVLGFANLTYSMGGFFGPWAAGIIIIAYGWPSVYFLLASLGFLVSLPRILLTRSKPAAQTTPDQPTKKPTALHPESTKWNTIIIYLTMFLSNMAFYNLLAWTPSYLVETKGFNLDSAGLAFSSFSLLGGGTSILLGYASDRFKSRRLLASATGLVPSAICYLLFTGSDPGTTTLLLGIIGAVFYPYWNLQLAMGQESVQKEKMGAITGLMQNAAYVSGIVGPAIAGFLIGALGIGSAMNFAVVLPLAAYGLIVLLWRPPRNLEK